MWQHSHGFDGLGTRRRSRVDSKQLCPSQELYQRSATGFFGSFCGSASHRGQSSEASSCSWVTSLCIFPSLCGHAPLLSLANLTTPSEMTKAHFEQSWMHSRTIWWHVSSTSPPNCNRHFDTRRYGRVQRGSSERGMEATPQPTASILGAKLRRLPANCRQSKFALSYLFSF